MKKLAVLFMCAAMLASCDFKGGSKDLKAENDSLLMELTQPCGLAAWYYYRKFSQCQATDCF